MAKNRVKCSLCGKWMSLEFLDYHENVFHKTPTPKLAFGKITPRKDIPESQILHGAVQVYDSQWPPEPKK